METMHPTHGFGEVFDRIRQELHREIVGQEKLIDRLLVALLADGHVLLEGVPGLAKTKTLTALTQVLDAQMSRTAARPLVTGQISVGSALLFASALGVASFVLLAVTTTLMAAFISLLAIAFYVLVYTLILKRSTPQNIVIGGAAGALPIPQTDKPDF